ncbi:ROK family transcriptional regulator [Cellulomonas humilata]|uniref:ROK family transcriptional regulator n=1 Tax=Cellulomonas humilata TaxID=144055 RepID=A0A7Y6A5B8_9CELL|nr:ROK family transcriptional regulator [Cellulomonas humilata]NUU18724.1 ROK family transcriptional regulator [Cellulomonas humilata]
MTVATTRDLRQQNRTKVLRTLVLSGETTRATLAADCELSPATVTNVVNELIDDGVVEEIGSVPSEGGRPIARLALRAAGAHMLGADVGERGVAVELFDLSMNRLDREFREWPVSMAGPAEIHESLGAAVAAVRARHPEVEATLVGLGLGLPGVVERDHEHWQEATLYAQNLGWAPTPVGDLVSAPGLEVFADNGANTLAVAEMWFGAARGADDAVVALLGRGIGLGVICGGQLVRGALGAAGEWGHTKIGLGAGPTCGCGATGCLEAYIGAHAILERWRATGAQEPGEGWRALSALVAAAEAGEPAAIGVVDETLDVLAVALANLVNLTNPERIVLGGWVGLRLLPTRRDDLTERVRRLSLHRPGSQFTVELCRFEGDSVALGAALMPLQAFIDRPRVRERAAVR